MKTQHEILEANIRGSLHADRAACSCALCGNIIDAAQYSGLRDIAVFTIDRGTETAIMMAHETCCNDLLAAVAKPIPAPPAASDPAPM